MAAWSSVGLMRSDMVWLSKGGLAGPRGHGAFVAHAWRVLLVATVCCLATAGVLAVPIHESEVPILQSIQSAWGKTFEAWGYNDDCIAAQELQCDEGGHITSMGVQYVGVSGPIPSYIGSLTALTYLSLSGNRLTGNIPASFGRLVNLQYLWVSNNLISGVIPMELSSLSSLKGLHLDNTQISGELPTFLASLVSLVDLEIPPNVTCPRSNAPCPNMPPEQKRSFTFCVNTCYDFCNTCGEVPVLLDIQTALGTTLFGWEYYNHCSEGVGLKCNSQGYIIEMDICCNAFDGYFPPVGRLTALTYLDLSSNSLKGTMTQELQNLVNLQVLKLAANSLNGPIIPQIGKLTALTLLDVGGNQLTGSIPKALSALAGLQVLSLAGNPIDGVVPAEVGLLTALTRISFKNTQIAGELPTSLANLVNLKVLDISSGVTCPPSNLACPNMPLPEARGVFCTQTCVDFCGSCGKVPPLSPPKSPQPRVPSPGLIPPSPLQKTPPKRPPPPRSPPPRSPPPRSPPPRSPPPRSPPPRSPPPRSPPPRSPPPHSPPPRSPPSPRSLPPKSPQLQPPPPRPPPPPVPGSQKRPPPGKALPPPGAGLLFGFVPALMSTSRFFNGGVFRHASSAYNYGVRRNWKIDSSTDWTTTNNPLGQAITLPVKEQGPCAACWAMAPVTAASAAAAIIFNTLEFGFVPDLSVQQVISCSGTSKGCEGGLPSAAFDYLVSFARSGLQGPSGMQGLFTENNYKYTATNATCQLPTCPTCKPTPYGITMFEQADFYGWFGLLLTLQQQPAVVTLYAACTAFLTYTSGILEAQDAGDCEFVPNHAVVAVGYVLNAGIPHWVLQNSWGTQWGISGRMHIAITGGYGLCNMHLSPALYPVITRPEACSNSINPCGSGTCMPNGSGSNKCICFDPFVNVTNMDGRTQSCVPKAICSFFLFNPCSVGTCLDDGLGGYLCICPLGFVEGERSTDGASTCVPSSPLKAQRYNVTASGTTCAVVAAAFGLSMDQLLLQNSKTRLACTDAGIEVGTVLNVTLPTGLASCNVLYAWNKEDSCVTVAQRFGLSGGFLELEDLNPWLKCSLPPPARPGMQVCVQRGSDAAYSSGANCTSYYTAQRGDTCDSIRQKFEMDALEFYGLNPGIYCSALQFADSNLLVSGQQVCVSTQTTSFRTCPKGSVPRSIVRGDTCLNLLARFFGSLQRMSALNYGFRCATRQLVVQKTICVPSSSGNRPPPPISKKSREVLK